MPLADKLILRADLDSKPYKRGMDSLVKNTKDGTDRASSIFSSFGGFVKKALPLIGLSLSLTAIVRSSEKLTEAMNRMFRVLEPLGDLFASVLNTAFDLIDKISGINTKLSESNDKLQRTEKTLFATAERMGFLGVETATTAKVFNHLTTKMLDFRTVTERTTATLRRLLADADETSGRSFATLEKFVTETMPEMLRQGKEFGAVLEAAFNTGITLSKRQNILLGEYLEKQRKIKEEVASMPATWSEAWKALDAGRNAINALGSAIGQVFQQMASDAGLNSKKFLGIMLDMVGTVAVSFGNTLLLIGAGFSLLSAGVSGPMIAAGAALIALGGTLKGVASGLGGSKEQGAGGAVGVGTTTDGVVTPFGEIGGGRSVVEINLLGASMVPREAWPRLVQDFIAPAIRDARADGDVSIVRAI